MKLTVTEVRTAPGVECPKCGSTEVIWIRVGLSFGMYKCKSCGNEGW